MTNETRCGTCRYWFAWSSLYKRTVAKRHLQQVVTVGVVVTTAPNKSNAN